MKKGEGKHSEKAGSAGGKTVKSHAKVPEVPEVPAEPQPEPYEEKIIRIGIQKLYIIPQVGKQVSPEMAIQVQHVSDVLEEPHTFPCNPEGETEINLYLDLKTYPTKPDGIDEIVSNPVLFTVLDVSSKSQGGGGAKKGGKEEKVNVFGRCNLDLLPLILGEKQITECLLIEQEKKAVAQEVISWPNLPRLSVTAEIDELFIPIEKLKNFNVFHVTVESIQNLLPSMMTNAECRAATVFPIFSEEMQKIYFENGIYSEMYEPGKFKKWTSLSHLEGNASLSEYSLSNDTSAVKTVPRMNLPEILSRNSRCIEWNGMRRGWLNGAAVSALFENLKKYKCWPLEIYISGSGGKSKGKKGGSQLHFIAYLDITGLLYPGETKARTACQLFTYNQDEVKEKCGLEASVFSYILDEIASSSSKAKKSSKTPAKDEEVEEPSVPLVTDEEEPVFVIAEVELLRPLIAKSTLEDLEKRLFDAIPQRNELPKYVITAKIANEQYANCIQMLSDIISDEFKKFSLKFDTCDDSCSNSDTVLDSFYTHLKHTEGFRGAKAILKDKVTILIREKYAPQATYTNEREKQNFISDVYINLVEDMHTIVNNLLDGGDKVTDNTFDVTCDQRYYFAIEEIEEGSHEKAKKLYLARIAHSKKNPDYWIDYAVFFISTNDIENARECVKEALTLDLRHRVGLLLYALILTKFDELHEAETFLEALVTIYPCYAEGWIIFHLFYLKTERIEGADITLRTANNLCDTHEGLKDFLCIKSEPLAWTSIPTENASIFLETTVLLLKLHAYEFAEICLAQELIYSGSSIPYLYYLSVNHYLAGRYNDAIFHLESVVQEDVVNPYCWSLLGHCHYKLGDKEMASQCYNLVVDLNDRPEDIHLTMIRLGKICMEKKNYEKAKINFLGVCKISPTPNSWLLLGTAYFLLEQMEEAEKAFAEANMLDPLDPEIWGYLSIINLHLDREEECKRCFKYSIKARIMSGEETREEGG